MSTTLRSVLTVNERVVRLAITVAVRDNNLDILARDMDRGIQWLVRHIVVDQVQKTILRDVGLAIKHDGKTEV